MYSVDIEKVFFRTYDDIQVMCSDTDEYKKQSIRLVHVLNHWNKNNMFDACAATGARLMFINIDSNAWKTEFDRTKSSFLEAWNLILNGLNDDTLLPRLEAFEKCLGKRHELAIRMKDVLDEFEKSMNVGSGGEGKF
jgi:hypothetical protein